MFSKKQVSLVAAALASLAMCGSAFASGSAQANLGVSANVPTDCVISTTAVAFGAYKPLTTNASSALQNTGGKISVTCANGGTGAAIALDGGLNGAGTATTRNMASTATATDKLAYQLYSASDFTTVWGITGVTGVAATADGTNHDYTVYAQVAPGLTATVVHSDYSDTVVATVTF
jgi:spore coat protein U-like protein